MGTQYRTAVLVLALATLVVRAYSISRWTWTDDDWIFMHQSGSMGLGAYLFQDHHGHVAPVGLLVTLVMTRMFPLDFAPVVVVAAVVAAGAVVAWAAAFREIFGERLRLLAPLALIALTPLAVRPTDWWASALFHLPLQVVMALSVLFSARYARRPSVSGLLCLMAVFVFGFFCNESTVLVVAPILATVLFCSEVGFVATLRRTWPLVVALAGTVVAYAVVYRLIASSARVTDVGLGPDRWPGAEHSLEFYSEALTNALAPAVFGGPWGSTPVLTEPLASTSTWIRALTTVTLVLLTLGALLVRRRAWIPITMAVSYAVVEIALVLFSNRYLVFGEITIHDERYTLDVVIVWALAAAMLITPARHESPSSAFRRSTPAWLATRRWGLVLGAVLAVSLTVANVQVISRNGTHPAKSWLHNLRADIDRRAPVALYDTRPSDDLILPPLRQGLLSQMLSPLGNKLSFNGPAETLMVPDRSGHLRPAVVTRSASALQGPVAGCGYAIRSSTPQQIPLGGNLFPYPWGMQVTAFAGVPSVLDVEVDGKSIQIPVAKGFGRQQVGFEGSVNDVTIALQPGSHPVCVTDLTFGQVKPGIGQ